jgi:hypothetical protein
MFFFAKIINLRYLRIIREAVKACHFNDAMGIQKASRTVCAARAHM